MADNVTLDAGSGGSVIAADDISSVFYQRVKPNWGPDGTANEVDAASGKALPVQGEAAENAAVTGNPVQVGGRYDATPRTLGDGDVGGIALDADGAVQVSDGGNSLTVDNGGTFAVQSTLQAGSAAIGKLAANSGVDIGDVDVTSCDGIAAEGAALGNGILLQGDDGTDRKNINVDATTGDVQVDVTNTVTVDGSGVTQPVSGTVTANLSATDNTVLDNIQASVDTVAAAVSTEMQCDIVGALPAGTNAIGKLAANSGVDIGDVDVTSCALPTGAATAANQLAAGHTVTPIAGTSGGCSIFRSLDIDESEEQIKGTAGQLYTIHAMNLTASVVYLKFYNATAASVTVGTTTPVMTYPIPTLGDTNGAGFVLDSSNGFEFGTAITVACTTGLADADTGAPAANACVINIGYK